MSRAILALPLAALIALSGCATTAKPSLSATPSQVPIVGSIEIAASTACATEGPTCIKVNEYKVVPPTSWKKAKVTEASSSKGSQGITILLQVDADGRKVLTEATKAVVQTGPMGRLVLQASGKPIAAVAVSETIDADKLQLTATTEAEAAQVLALVKGS